MKGEPSLLSLQRARNAQTRDAWEAFGEHREQVMRLLRPDTSYPAVTLCLIGAGNCNDVDLASLCGQYDRIELVDWDAAALEAGVARQSIEAGSQIMLRGGVDVTSIGGELSQWRAAATGSDQAFGEICARAASASLPADLAPAETVASLCILSQLVELCAAAIQSEDPRLLPLIQAVRLGHLRQLAGAIRPGGKGILVTDLVSSDTAPELARTCREELPFLLRRLLEERNFFTGLHPQALHSAFTTDPVLCRLARDCRPTAPWLWRMGPRIYAVFALVFRRSGEL